MFDVNALTDHTLLMYVLQELLWSGRQMMLWLDFQ
jgi:hypothetical protein